MKKQLKNKGENMKATEETKPKMAIPTQRVTDPDFKYVPQAKTNVQETWKRFGWVPPVHKEDK